MDKPVVITRLAPGFTSSMSIRMEPLNAVTFTLPSMPVSVNSMYQIVFRERRVELKPEARRWKTKAKEHMPPWKYRLGAEIRIDVHFELQRFTGGGKPRVRDVSNLLKLLIDAVAERYGFNDCLVVAGSWTSAESKCEQVTVIVTEMEEHNP